MLIFDELKKNDPQLRLVALMLAAGLGLLLVGLWWVQVVSSQKYQNHLETQAYRTVRIPAMRGKILDREGRVLAENRPSYNLSFYLDDLRNQFDDAYAPIRRQALAAQKLAIAAQEKKLGRSLTKAERKQFAFTTDQLQQFHAQARLSVASALTAQLSQQLGQPLTLDAKDFEIAYERRRALPYPILKNLDDAQIARFEEKFTNGFGADLELQATRFYPGGTTAAHVLGYLRSDNDSAEGEDAYFSYRLPDYRGVVGIEGGFDKQLRGRAGEESVLVNNLGYRQSENVWTAPDPGQNLVLTLDLELQRAAEASLLQHRGPDARAAIVVVDVRNGDVLVMASSPAVDPNDFINGFTPADMVRWNDPKQLPQINRATQQNYAPGSIFKPIVGLAALEDGLDPNALVDNPGYVYVGRRHIGDLAPPGKYDFRRAIIESCNTYFITVGLRVGIEKVVRMADKFHFGERTGLPTRQETKGVFPTLEQVQSPDWHDGNSANICIGQGEMSVTPLQMALAYAAIANGGTLYWPRLVSRLEPQDPNAPGPTTEFPAGLVRDHLDVSARSLKILHDAMLAETVEGTGQPAQVPGLQICGKTGTAEVMNARNQKIDRTTWFASYAPYEKPRYAVVVMVESGTFGGPTCAPIAHDIYEAILKQEKSAVPESLAAVK